MIDRYLVADHEQHAKAAANVFEALCGLPLGRVRRPAPVAGFLVRR